jgi:hypothetical protein
MPTNMDDDEEDKSLAIKQGLQDLHTSLRESGADPEQLQKTMEVCGSYPETFVIEHKVTGS